MILTNWIMVALALYGTWLNAKRNRTGFIYWIITNLWFSGFNAYIGNYPIATLFFTYLILAVYGYRKWGESNG